MPDKPIEVTNVQVVESKPYALQLLEHGVSTDQLEKLLELQERHEANEARKVFYADMANAQAEMPMAPEDKYNQQTKSHYSSYKALAAACKPVYTAHGLSLVFYESDCPKDDHIRVSVNVSHRLGHVETYHTDVPMDSAGIAGKVNKTPTHAKGSSFSYGRSYLMKLVFNLPTGDDDDGQAAGTEFITDEQAQELEAIANEARGGVTALLKFLKGHKPPINSITEIPAVRYDAILTEVKKRLPE